MSTTEKDYVVTYDGNVLRVLCDGIVFETNTRPGLTTMPGMVSVNYETAVGNAFWFDGTTRLPMTDEQVAEARAFADAFKTVADFEVQAFSPDDLVFAGTMNRSEAVASGLCYAIGEAPDGRAYKFSCLDDSVSEFIAGQEYQGGWDRVVAVIRRDGSLVLDPAGICEQCVLKMTEGEWTAFPRPAHETDTWDFDAGEWRDERSFAQLRYYVETDIRNHFERERWYATSSYVAPYEQATWDTQYAEAMAWLSDQGADTPYIDAFLAARTDADIPTKRELAEDIVANHAGYLKAMARVSGEQWSLLAEVKRATTNEELDAIREKVAAMPLVTPED